MFSNLSSSPERPVAVTFIPAALPTPVRGGHQPITRSGRHALYLRHPRRHSTDGSRLDAIGCHSTHTIRATTQFTDDHTTEASAAGYLYT